MLSFQHMDEEQTASLTEFDLIDGTKTEAQKLINLQQEWWIDFCALGGLITFDGFEVDAQGKNEIMKRVSVSEFAKQIGVSRSTLARWRRTIPNFYERIVKRRSELFGARESALFNRLYLIAMSGSGMPSVEASKLLLGHFSGLQLPTQRQEVKHEGLSWADLVEQKKQAPIEGEIVNE